MHDLIVEMLRMPEKKSHNDWLSFEVRVVKSVKDWWEFKDQSETVWQPIDARNVIPNVGTPEKLILLYPK